MIDTFLALVIVAAVLAVHGLIKLLILPFRILRDLFRYCAALTRLTSR